MDLEEETPIVETKPFVESSSKLGKNYFYDGITSKVYKHRLSVLQFLPNKLQMIHEKSNI